MTALSPGASAPPTDGYGDHLQQNQPQQTAKKRRKLEEELETQLGAGWDVHVDDFGRRPRRATREKIDF